MDDHLPVPHVVLLDLIPFADAPKLGEGVPGILLVGRPGKLLLVLGGDETERVELWIGHVVEGDEIGPAFFKGRVILLDRLLGLPFDPRTQFAGGMADDLVHVDQEFAGKRPPFRGAVRLGGIPGELLAERA